jgi:hypothetical protein
MNSPLRCKVVGKSGSLGIVLFDFGKKRLINDLLGEHGVRIFRNL